MASLGATIWIIMTLWDRFQKELTINELDTFTDDITINFPQIFLCLDWSQLNHSGLDKTKESLYEKVYNWQWDNTFELLEDESKDEKNFNDIFQLLIPDCSAFFSNCTFSGKEMPCSKSLIKTITFVGACYKFTASKALTIADSPWALSFVPLVYPFRLYLMDKMDIGPQRDDRPLDVIYEPTLVEINIDVTYSTPDLLYLTQRQRQCHYENESLTVNNCVMRCRSDRIFEMCGCVPWFLAAPGQEECPLYRYSCANLSTNTIDCDCMLPCDHMSYNCHKIAAIDDNKAGATDRTGACEIVTKWPSALFRKKIRFGYLDLLVSFGGIAGLFLGYSIVTSVEMLYYFTLKVYCGAVVEASRKKCNIIKVRVIEV